MLGFRWKRGVIFATQTQEVVFAYRTTRNCCLGAAVPDLNAS